MNEKLIFEKLKQILENVHAPFSNYKVACVLITDKGEYTGVNVEPDVLNLGVCAERNAIFSTITQHGGNFKILHVYILTTSKNNFGTPCGGCRQVISQFANSDIKVTSFRLDGTKKDYTVEGLLPEMWSKKDLA